MSKMLVSLIIVLALVSIASAGTAQWNNAVDVGNWEDSSNWVQTGTVAASLPPGSGDFAAPYPAAGGFTAVTMLLSSSQSVGRAKWQFQTATLDILNGGTLTNNGSVGSCQMYGDTAATIDIQSGGAFIAKGSNTGIQTGNGTQLITVESGGLLGVYSNGTGHLATNALWLGGTSAGGGTSTVDVYGTLDADSITLVNSNDVLKLHVGGVINVYGTLSGSITAIGGSLVTTTGVTDTVAGSPLYGLTVTQYTVPEPATVALLGLGGLLLRRKR